jgi:hypothetical protein
LLAYDEAPYGYFELIVRWQKEFDNVVILVQTQKVMSFPATAKPKSGIVDFEQRRSKKLVGVQASKVGINTRRWSIAIKI